MNEPLVTRGSSTRDIVYAGLREQILSLELPPGTALSEKDSAASYGVSRTPVREAFLRLAQEQLVQVLPQRGTFVSLIDPELVEEARFMREQLERAVIRLACAGFPPLSLSALRDNLRAQQDAMTQLDDRKLFELDEAFHRTLFEGCGKLNTWSVIQQMNLHLNRARLLRLATDPHWSHLYEQHAAMAEAIADGREEAADDLMRQHLRLGIADQELLKKEYPHYFKPEKENAQ
ncbi:GntR family transcriptional regulator [Paenibacillus sp. D9]|uniref:GntR family transcriptional regulator n=1 Tax=Paenibacillus sp. D9 TaxID=665792 RepID=UPI00061F6A60|nr:GntR family transcriptional regulator [Paenibacillus sp. D9]KKC46098.1 GntR family transcriptional regulator [Paenibacillus sp. D9]